MTDRYHWNSIHVTPPLTW